MRNYLFALLLTSSALAQTPPSPDEHLGRKLACDFQLADWKEVSSYYGKLEATTGRVKIENAGKTTDGRDMLLAIVSSEANLQRLDAIKADSARLADPRGLSPADREAILARGKVVAMISPAMHSTETAAPQMAMQLTYLLATSNDEPWRSVRENCVVLVLPCTNPDGLDDVVAWYRKTVGTPYEASGMTKLYQRYTGHDNNRDWFMVSQKETRAISRLLYSEWHPQVYWDVHQQGSKAERIFIPPFRDPLNPNLDAGIITGLDALCSRALHDMTRDGLSGVATGITFDMWWNGGNRTVPVRHNMIGILTEAASVEIASPIFLRFSDLRPPGDLKNYAPSNRFPDPWPGGWWRLSDIVRYELGFGKSLLTSLAREPSYWLRNQVESADRAIARGREGAPRAWIVPLEEEANRDRGAVERLVDALLVTGVEVGVAGADFVADGRTWKKGSLVVRRDQPYGDYVADLFGIQRFPPGDTPYDVAGWTLPLLLGVNRVEVEHGLPNELPVTLLKNAADAVSNLPARAGGMPDLCDSSVWQQVFASLKDGKPVTVRPTGFDFSGTPPTSQELSSTRLSRLPRIGIYDTWGSSMDEGWLRFVLDQFHVPYVTVKNEMIRAGNLASFLDVLVIPSIGAREIEQGRAEGSIYEEFTGGLDPEGDIAIKEFVESGNTLIALDASAKYAIDLFKLPISDATRGEKAKDFKCPGSVLRIEPNFDLGADALESLTNGLPPSMACFFDGSTAFEFDAKGASNLKTLASYAATDLLLSGYIAMPEAIAGKAAWLRVKAGKGRVHLFGFRPHFRSWTQQTFQLLFRALLIDAQGRK